MAEQRRACAACGTTNEEDARFCEGCGGALGRACATCGVEANATARFCRACGATLDDPAEPTADSAAAGPSRKTVTVMFADLTGSTSFEEQVDAETAREVMSRYHDILRSTAERNRAGVTKYIGDGFMAVWGVPEIGPDDADHAVDTAVELQERFVDFAALVTEAHGVDLALRVAVNTGEVVVGAGDADLVGDALNVAARLESECPRGHVVVGEETWRSTRGRYGYESLGQVQVKGRTAPVAVYQWLGRQSEATDAAAFVGRADEVRRLQVAFDGAIAAQAARLVTVIGDPGVGKSRLAAEFAAAQGDSHVIEARCDVEQTVALAPIVEVLRARDLETDVPATTPDRDRILRDLNGLTAGIPGSVEETFWALRRYVELLARGRPLIIVVDDIQWADTLLLDFVEHLAEWVQEVPVLMLALARPELREIRPDLVSASTWVTEAVHLGGLDAEATAELAAGVLGAARLPEELVGRLPSSTGGNPLFVRELVGMLVHDGVLVAEPVGWRLTIDADAIAIPPTIHALLASRLERLSAPDRRVLEIASVVGTDFSLGAVCALAERGAAVVKSSLDRLRRLELAQPSGTYLGDEPVWRFHHVLIRDVAYRRLLKSDRADLHERLADWIEAGGASVAFDSDEMIARHLEAAHGYRRELGTLDEHTRGLALRSARCYLSSARRALDRDELVSAGTQAARGAGLAAANQAVHAELLLVGCEAFLSAGDVAAGAPLVDDLDRIAGEALAPWATCYRCQFVVYTDPERLLEVDARLQSAIDEFGRLRDPAGLAKAHRVRAGARARLGRIGDAEVDLFEALIAARQGGDHRQITAALGAAPSAALWGPSPVPKAGGRCLDVVRMQRMTTAAPSLEATSLRCLAVLELLRGRPDKARSMLADARQVVADLGLRHGLMETELFAGIIESMVGDQVAAEPHFRTAMEGLDALGVGADAGQAAALLARSVLAQGRVDEADRYATESEHLAGHNLKTAIAWRAARAEILAAQGRYDEAVEMARDAVGVAAGTDLVLDHAEACLAFSRVLAAAGDAKGANGARADAERLYAAKEVATTIGRMAGSAVPAAPPPTSMMTRLAITNRASELTEAFVPAMRAHDVDTLVNSYADRFVYDDRRRLSGAPVSTRAEMRAAFERVFEQFTVFDGHTVAVRGERLVLRWNRWADHDGNESVGFTLFEVDEDERTIYAGRFDEDDFEGAYRDLEDRYYAGEGAAFATNGRAATGWMECLNRVDVDAARRLAHPDFRWIAPPSSLKAEERSVDELFRWLQERANQVSSLQHSNPVMRWLSPNCNLSLGTVRAVGRDGEAYEWTRIYVSRLRDGLLASVREFDADDEDAAFAYAEALVAERSSRLAVTNRASEIVEARWLAMRSRDVDTLVQGYSDRFVYDDRRRMRGDPIVGLTAMRAAIERIFNQYTQFELHVLAVRGERLLLASSRWSDDAGNETSFLHVAEVGEDRRTTYDGRFDENDFEGAYRELEQRYYAGEGAAFAEAGYVSTESIVAINHNDFDRLVDDLYAPGMRVENRSRSAFPDRSSSDLRASFTELNTMVASSRMWFSAVCWLSPACTVLRMEREAVGQDGERYAWTKLLVVEIRDGQTTTLCQFDVEDAEAAFAYADERVRATTTRLAITNRASESVDALIRAMQANDIDSAMAVHSDRFEYVDRRRLSGDPVDGLAGFRKATERFLEQYSRCEAHTLAVRGERLALHSSRFGDDAGNEATYLGVFEADEDGRIESHTRFDGDDFDGAYRELEHRYYTGEGAAFAPNGHLLTEWLAAMNRLDTEAARSLSQAEFRWLATPSALSVDEHSVDDLFRWLEERAQQVSSVWHCVAAISWLSPDCSVGLGNARAVGLDGEDYEWTRLLVGEYREGLLASVRQFDLDDEEAAFAYAEAVVTPQHSRLAVTNRASEIVHEATSALPHDLDAYIALHSDRFTYDDRRQLSGDPVEGLAEFRKACERFLEQYSRIVAWRVLAVRGDSRALAWGRWSDDAGNETAFLTVFEVGDDGLIESHVRFDEDDFEGAYRELEHRYYTGEGAALALNGHVLVDFCDAMDRLDVDAARRLVLPEFHWLAPRSMLTFEDRSIDDFFRWLEGRAQQVSSVKYWVPVLRWLSPTCLIGRGDIRAIGPDGEEYDGRGSTSSSSATGSSHRCTSSMMTRRRLSPTPRRSSPRRPNRLAVTNRASEIAHVARSAMQAHDADSCASHFSDRYVFDDRRALSGDPIQGRDAVRTAAKRVLEQYSRIEGQTLAVRGQRLVLCRSRWSDDSGNETNYFQLYELGDDDRIEVEVRFDEGDFAGAYRELERRYYAGEGAAFAESGAVYTEWLIALNQGDLDRLFGDLTAPDMRVEVRSRSVFGDRSTAELRASIEELNAMVVSSRSWHSAVHWMSPTCCVGRNEREAVGRDGEQYTWTRLHVFEVRNGRGAALCEFEIDDEEAAFAYAEERMRAASSRLALTNRATEVMDRLLAATYARDFDAVAAAYADPFVYDDRRRLSGDPIDGQCGASGRHRAHPRAVQPFETRTLAVRGERLQLAWSRWSDDSGNETTYLHVLELDDDGRIAYEVASTRTTSRAPTASSSAATTPAKAPNLPSRVRSRPNG